MKIYLAVFLFAFFQFALFPRDITTLSGTTYRDVKVNGASAIELTISYADKEKPERTIMKPIPFTDLPDEIRREFKYDPAKAEVFLKTRRELNDKKTEVKNQDDPNKAISDVPGANISTNGVIIAPGELPLKTESADSKRKTEAKAAVAEGNKDVAEAKAQRDTDKAVSDATDVNSSIRGGTAPGELHGSAESLDIMRKGAEKNSAPGAKEGAAESDKIRNEAVN